MDTEEAPVEGEGGLGRSVPPMLLSVRNFLSPMLARRAAFVKKAGSAPLGERPRAEAKADEGAVIPPVPTSIVGGVAMPIAATEL